MCGNARTQRGHGMASAGAGRWALVLTGAIFLTACEEGSLPFLEKKQAATEEDAVAVAGTETTFIERDVEAPEVFQVTDAGLWDGRPSLGGVWVAHADVTDPERVIIRNQANGKFVIGALFRRERENPGPRIQVSSDAAEALGMLAGAPVELNVVALRREEAPIVAATAATETLATEEIEATALDPVAAVAASAIDKAEGREPPEAGPKMSQSAILSADPTTAAAATSAPAALMKSSLDKPFIQLGIFSVEANAEKTADILRKDGILPVVKKSALDGKDYWRVLAGPAGTMSDRSAMLAKIKKLGFSDAYAVTN